MGRRGYLCGERLTSFVGREADHAAVADRLARRRLVTLAGPGGVGKSRLAVEVAAATTDRYTDGVCVVDLVATPADRVVTACLTALRAGRAPTRVDLDVLVDHLSDRTLLLLLDNCDRIAPAAGALVAALLAGCPEVRVLATSRSPLDVDGECVWQLDGLSVDAPAGEVPAAVELLADRARDLDRRFRVHDGNTEALSRLCRRLDGLPLAIELAAAHLPSFTPGEVLARVGCPSPSLAHPEDDGDRHGSMRAMVDWSWTLLDGDEQAVFLRLGTFEGPFDREMACVVAGGGRDQEAFDRVLHRLVRRSLVARAPESVDGRARFRLLETLRWYARGRLAAAGERDGAYDAHAAAHTALAEAACEQLVGRDQGAWLERLERCHDDLAAAVEWRLRHGDAEGAQRLTGSLARFWDLRGHYAEGLAWSRRACALPGRVDPSVSSLAHNGLATLAALIGDVPVAVAALEVAERTARTVGDDANLGYALQYQGLLALLEADPASARPLLAAAVQAAVRCGDPTLEALSAVLQLESYLQAGDLDAADEAAGRADAARARSGDAEVAGWLSVGRVMLALDREEPAAALVHLERAAGHFAALEARWGLSVVGALVAVAHAAAGRWPEAVAAAGRADLLRETIDAIALPSWASRLQRSLGDSRARLGAARFEATWDEARRVSRSRLMDRVLEDVARLVGDEEDPPARVVEPEPAILHREHDVWLVGWRGRTARVRHRVGLGHLAVLLTNPGEPVASLELATRRPRAVRPSEPGLCRAGDGAGPLLDATAIRAYRARLAELQTELDEATRWCDLERAASARREMEALSEQLTAAVGLGGRVRTAASDVERARKAVTKALRSAIDDVRSVHQALAEHLDRAVATGAWCVYRPDPTSPVTWDVRSVT